MISLYVDCSNSCFHHVLCDISVVHFFLKLISAILIIISSASFNIATIL